MLGDRDPHAREEGAAEREAVRGELALVARDVHPVEETQVGGDLVLQLGAGRGEDVDGEAGNDLFLDDEDLAGRIAAGVQNGGAEIEDRALDGDAPDGKGEKVARAHGVILRERLAEGGGVEEVELGEGGPDRGAGGVGLALHRVQAGEDAVLLL